MNRNTTIDRAKGFLILLVILGHILNYADPSYSIRPYIALSLVINSFHMSAFFLISGCLFSKDKWKGHGIRFILTRLKGLMLPYYVFEVIGLLYKTYVLKNTTLGEGIVNMLTFRCNVGADWFFPALFVASFILWAVSMTEKRWPGWILAVMFLCIPVWPVPGSFLRALVRGLMGFVFMWIGYRFKDYFLNQKRPLVGLLSGMLLLVLSLAELKLGGGDYYYASIGNPLLFLACGLCGSVAIFFLAELLDGKESFLVWLGKNSLIIVGSHQLVLYTIPGSSSPIWVFAIFVLIIVLESILILVWNRSKSCLCHLTGKDVSVECRRDGRAGAWIKSFIIVLLSICFLVALYLFTHITHDLTKVTYRVTSNKITSEIRLVFLSDLHLWEYGGHNEALIDQIRASAPDLICMGGDMVNRDDQDIRVVTELVEELVKICPVYYGMGNHEYTWMDQYGDSLVKFIKDSGAILVNNSYEDVNIKGNLLRIGGFMGYYKLYGMFPFSPEEISREEEFCESFENTEDYKLLINHIPTQWIDWGFMDKTQVDLVLSGHYHGGLWNLPLIGPVYAPYQGWNPPHGRGLFHGKTTDCVLGGGLGNEYSFLPRINNPPELVELIIN